MTVVSGPDSASDKCGKLGKPPQTTPSRCPSVLERHVRAAPNLFQPDASTSCQEVAIFLQQPPQLLHPKQLLSNVAMQVVLLLTVEA